MKKAYICFTRVPLPGFTKTCLITALGAQGAANLHEAFRKGYRLGKRQAARRTVSFPSPRDPGLLKEIFPKAHFHPQEGTWLGQRIHHALPACLCFLKVTSLKGRDLVRHGSNVIFQPGRPLKNSDAYRRILAYLEPDFLEHILERYVRSDFLKEAGPA